jgi:hypothetical protein
MFYPWSSNPQVNTANMSRFQRENIAASSTSLPGTRRPQPPRGLQIVWAAPRFTLTWVAPQNLSGVLGYNIYQDNENTRIQNLADPGNLSTQIQMPTGFSGKVGFYVSAYTLLLESVKVPIIGVS